MNRYSEKAAQRAIGIETVSVERYVPAHMGIQATRLVHWIVEPERHVRQVSAPFLKTNPQHMHGHDGARKTGFLQPCQARSPVQIRTWSSMRNYDLAE